MNMGKIFRALKNLPGLAVRNRSQLESIQTEQDQIKINQGTMLSILNESRTATELKEYEFKVFSQWGEDGIIQHLVKNIEIKNKTFIEFGVENFSESNCRFLMMKDNWQGFVIDGSEKNITALRNSYYFWKYDISAIAKFITTENINDLLAESSFERDIGILSIDLDGNDYHILDAINYYLPRILVCEYNSVFGPWRSISVPYSHDFNRSQKHYSNLYWGASLSAMTHLASKKGYTLVGTNSAGGNAFYIRNDLVTHRVPRLTAEQAFLSSNFRESRDERGVLTYLRGSARHQLIAGLPVINVQTGELEEL